MSESTKLPRNPSSSKRQTMRFLVVALVMALGAVPALAANKPCSGKKGGIAHCSGDKFVCKDGSTSASKRKCSGY